MIKISIKQLDPLLVSHKIIRVGGRFRKPSFTEAEQHPVMLPRISVVSDGIIQWSHNSVAHGARGLTLNHFTNTSIQIICSKAAVRGVIYRYLSCCKLKGKTSFRKMTIYQSKEMHRRYTFHRLWSIYVRSLPHQRKKVTAEEIWSIIYIFFLSCHTYRSYKCLGH